MWEHRFQLIKPKRGYGNIRFYSVADVEYLLNISLLVKSGFKISTLAGMDAETIENNLLRLEREDDKRLRELHKLIISMFMSETEKFEIILDTCMLYWGIDETIKQIIIPFLERVRIFSCKDCDIEVDFAMTAIRKKLIVGIEKANSNSENNKTALLFLPKGEYFDLLLLYFNYLMKGFGIKVLYMGTNISIQKLKTVSRIKQPDFILTYISPRNQKGLSEMKEYLNDESALKCFITGFDMKMSKEFDKSKVRYIHYKESTQAIAEG